MEHWAVTVDTLYEKALSNTPLLFKPSVQPMEDIIRCLVNDHLQTDEINGLQDILPSPLFSQNSNAINPPMYVAGNIYGLAGATWLLQKEELRTLSRKLSSNLYILPSSIQEIIIIPYTDRISKDNLLTMVQEVNSTQVAPDEFLADNVYLYTREDDSILPLF
jgi:hypothetical protein